MAANLATSAGFSEDAAGPPPACRGGPWGGDGGGGGSEDAAAEAQRRHCGSRAWGDERPGSGRRAPPRCGTAEEARARRSDGATRRSIVCCCASGVGGDHGGGALESVASLRRGLAGRGEIRSVGFRSTVRVGNFRGMYLSPPEKNACCTRRQMDHAYQRLPRHQECVWL